MLEEQEDGVPLQFLVVVDGVDDARVVGYFHRDHLARLTLGTDVAKEAFDLGFRLVHIDVAHHDHALVLRVIPFLVVIPQLLMFEVIHHLHPSDGQSVTIFAVRVE